MFMMILEPQRVIKTSAIMLVSLFGVFTATAVLLGQSKWETQVAEARRLIEANCPDCEGASKEGLRQGIDLLDDALRNGDSSQVSATELLANAYGTLAILYTSDGSPEQRDLLKRKMNLYKEMLVKQPEDLNLLWKYSAAAEEASSFNEEIHSLERLLQIQHDDTSARFALALACIRAGKVDRAVLEGQTAIRSADQRQIDLYGDLLVHRLIAVRSTQAATAIRVDIRMRLESLQRK
jgi:tetratricopeptide (TPR) repeat protein